MQTITRTVLLALLALACSFGQTSSSGTIRFDDHPLALTSGGATVTWDDALGHWVSINGNLVVAGNLSVSSAHKDDGHGPTLLQVKASAHPIRDAELAPASYVDLATSIGVEAPASEARIIRVIHDADLPVYSFDKVDGYLWRAALKAGPNTRWVWKPLRHADIQSILDAGVNWHERAGVGTIVADKYARRVPIEILATMKSVLDSAPDAVFFVSDYETVKPDPFLAVTTRELLGAGKLWIVAQWGEPGFSESPCEECKRVIAAVTDAVQKFDSILAQR